MNTWSIIPQVWLNQIHFALLIVKSRHLRIRPGLFWRTSNGTLFTSVFAWLIWWTLLTAMFVGPSTPGFHNFDFIICFLYIKVTMHIKSHKLKVFYLCRAVLMLIIPQNWPKSQSPKSHRHLRIGSRDFFPKLYVYMIVNTIYLLKYIKLCSSCQKILRTIRSSDDTAI